MNKKGQILGWSIGIGAIAITLIVLLFYFGVFGTLQQNVQLVGIPTFGTVICDKPDSPTRTLSQSSLGCDSNGVCTLPGSSLEIPPTSFNQGYISDYSLTAFTTIDTSFFQDGDAFVYSICNVGDTTCRIKDQATFFPDARTKQQINIGNGAIGANERVIMSYLDYCSLGESCSNPIIVSGCSGGLNGCNYKPKIGGTFTGTYQIYQLFRQDVLQGGRVKIEETCADPITLSKSQGIDLVTSTSLPNIKTASSPHNFKAGEYVNYVSNFVVSVQNVETYSGQQAYCSNRNMYGFDTVNTIEGKQYLVANLGKNLGSVACCNVEVESGRHCDNHQWVSDAVAKQCELPLNPCPYEGIKNVDTSDPTRKTLLTQSCVSNSCVTTKTQVECADNAACPEGNVCSADYKCVKTSIVGGGNIASTCGNNICEGNENNVNCPVDCKSTQSSKTSKSIFWITFAIVVILAFLITILMLPIENIWIKTVVALIIAIIIAFIISWLVTLAAKLLIPLYKFVVG